MKKTTTSCLSILLVIATSSFADTNTTQSVQFSVDNTNSDSFSVGIYPYLRAYNNDFSTGDSQDVYTAKKWGLSSPCGHHASVQIRDDNKICPLTIDFKIAQCKREPAQISIDITNSLVVALASPTNSVSDITYHMPIPHGECGFGASKLTA